MIRKIVGFGLLLFIFCASLQASAVEHIEDYKVEIWLTDTTKFIVEETIHYDFGPHRRHGIFRTIPVLLKRKTDTGFGEIYANYEVVIDDINITFENGGSVPFHKKYKHNLLYIRIGDPDQYVQGQKTYKIRYSVNRAYNSFDEHDEFYWNAIGTQWNIPIKRADISVHYHPGISPIRSQNFYGYRGNKSQLPEIGDEEGTYHIIAENLKSRSGVTLNFAFSKGAITYPTSFQKLIWFMKDNFPIVWSFLYPIILLIFFIFLHNRDGRDPKGAGVITVQYGPPEGYTPAEVGTIIDEVVHNSDITSTIFYLAQQGFITIEKVETKTILFLEQKDYIFKRTDKDPKLLDSVSHEFYKELMTHKDEVKLSELKNHFYRKLPNLKDRIYSHLVEKKVFAAHPGDVRTKYILLGVIPSIIGCFGMIFFFAKSRPETVLFLIGSVVASAVISALFSKLMVKKTRAGKRVEEHILGLEEFIKKVEKDRLKRMLHEDSLIFEKILPFAVVLGLADEWAERFEGLDLEPAQWMVGHNGRYSTRAFVSEIGSSMKSMEATFVSAPRSSGSGGSSGFSGGSSGGGFGGGGGGSW